MKKLISALLVLALLMTTGCSLAGKNGSDAKKMDAFLKDYAKFAALSDDAEAGIEAAADNPVRIIPEEYDYILIDP